MRRLAAASVGRRGRAGRRDATAVGGAMREQLAQSVTHTPATPAPPHSHSRSAHPPPTQPPPATVPQSDLFCPTPPQHNRPNQHTPRNPHAAPPLSAPIVVKQPLRGDGGNDRGEREWRAAAVPCARSLSFSFSHRPAKPSQQPPPLPHLRALAAAVPHPAAVVRVALRPVGLLAGGQHALQASRDGRNRLRRAPRPAVVQHVKADVA